MLHPAGPTPYPALFRVRSPFRLVDILTIATGTPSFKYKSVAYLIAVIQSTDAIYMGETPSLLHHSIEGGRLQSTKFL